MLVFHRSIILIRIPLSLLHNLLTKPTTSRIKLLTVLIPHLPTTLTPSILPALRKTLIQITTDNPLVQLGAADVFHAVQRVLVRVVLDKAEAAGRLVEPVEAHDQALDAAAFAEELVDLLFGGVEGEVADVEGCGVLELVDGFGGGGAVAGGGAALALVLLGGELVGCTEACGVGAGFGVLRCYFEGCGCLFWAYLGHGVGAWPVEAVDRAAHSELRHCGW
jgi:hypothetical protein